VLGGEGCEEDSSVKVVYLWIHENSILELCLDGEGLWGWRTKASWALEIQGLLVIVEGERS
jgi:hypothetical protein